MRKNILWKSDLWLLTVFFGVISAFCLGLALVHAVSHEPGEAFADALMSLIPLVLMVFCGFTDRGEAMRRVEIFKQDPSVLPLPKARSLPRERRLS